MNPTLVAAWAVRWLLLCIALFGAVTGAHGARLALVVGNDSYQNIQALRNARADARAIAAALQAAGYEVDLQTDRTQRQLQSDIRRLRGKMTGGDEVVVYFSGHGVQIGGINFLLPVDVSTDSVDQVRDEALSLSTVLEGLRENKPRLTLAVIDACRDNPFASRGRSIGGRGLAAVTVAKGEIVIYAAGEGQTALDRLSDSDPVRNGVFTRVFLREIAQPGISIRDIVNNVKDEVYRLAQSVGHEQLPSLYDQSIGRYYFRPPAAPTPPPEPPQIALLSPRQLLTGDAQVTIRILELKAGDAPITSVRVRVNGLERPPTRNLVPASAEGVRELRVDIPPADSEIELFAENRHGVSAAITVSVKRPVAPARQATPPAADLAGFAIRPRLYVLAAGVGDHGSATLQAMNRDLETTRIRYAHLEARDFAQTMQRQQGGLYRTVDVKVLTYPTRDNIVDGLDWLKRQVTQHDVAMLFLSGVGIYDASLRYGLVSITDIRSTLNSIAGKVVAFIDTSQQTALNNDLSTVIKDLASAENGVVVFSVSTGRQVSLEQLNRNDGAFTKALIEGIDGKADPQRSGRVTFKMLDMYVSQRVKELTQGSQTTVTVAPSGIPDFPIAVPRP